ncbi:MAG: hypothetical protein ACKPKO_49400, partial [Candidatus Fonsibacter sp.]
GQDGQYSNQSHGGQDLSGTYYHVYNYIHFIKLINKAFNVALSSLKGAMPKHNQGVTIIDAAVAPYSDFDPTTNRVILHAHQFFFDEVGVAITGGHYVEMYLTKDYTIYSLDSRTDMPHLMES